MSTRDEIINASNMSPILKALTLNFKTCYGTQEAMNRYYETGLLSPDNFKGTGVSHLVHIKDMIAFLINTGDIERAEMFKKQYVTGEEANNKHFWDFYTYKHGSPWAIKKFKKKLWVVELLDKNEPRATIPVALKIMNVVLNPVFFIMKYIPRKSVLKMDNYKVVTFRVGDVINGLSVEFHIPKKFSFN